jgi:uncharacterized delta-60 repeat protein
MNASRILQRISLAAAAVAVVFCSVPKAHAQAGQLDSTFGTGGIFATTSTKASATSGAIQSDQKIVVAGFGINSSQEGADTLFRLTTSGTLDPSFGTSGVVNLEPPSGEALGFFGVKIQPDGKIVALSEIFNAIIVVRVDTNGNLDPSFGSGGFTAPLAVPIGEFNTFPSALALQPDGKIVVVAGVVNPSVIARFDTNGVLDSTFGTSGVANLAFPGPTQVALQPDGKILVTSGEPGYAGGVPSQQAGTLARYNSNGTVDTTFGSAGIASSLPSGSALLVHGDGAIVVAGGTSSKVNAPPSASNIGFGLAAYNGNGIVARKFGTNGAAITDFGSAAPQTGSFALGLQSDGDIVAAGIAGITTSGVFTSSFGLARYTTAGVLDPTFGDNGIVITTVAKGQESFVTGVVIQADQKIVVVGTSVFNLEFSNAYVARYLSQ